MCPHSKVLLRNYKSQETKFIDCDYFEFLAIYEKILRFYSTKTMISYGWTKYEVYGQVGFLRGMSPFGCEIIPIDCGKCAYCKKKRINYWKFKLTCESKVSQDNTFLTLTFNEKYYFRHQDYSLVQKCMKRIRKNYNVKFKFFLVSEHGEQNTKRLHYHLMVFGIAPRLCKRLFESEWRVRVKVYNEEKKKYVWIKDPIGFVKVKGFEEVKHVPYIANYMFKQNEIRRQSQKIGYEYWKNYLSVGLVSLNGYKYNFPYYFRKKYFSAVNAFMNKLSLNKLKAKITKRLAKLKDNKKLSNFLFREAEQKEIEARQWFLKLGYKV